MTHTSALIVGAGSGLSASLARTFAKAGMKVALAARSAAKLAEFAEATGARTYNCDAARRDEVEALFAQLDSRGQCARCRRLQSELPRARAVDRSRSGRGREDHCHFRLRRLPGGAGGGAAHAAEEPRRAAVHRRVGQRQGLCAVGCVCHGQVRAARPVAKPGARTGSARHPCRAFCHRRRHQERGVRPSPPTSPTSMLDPDAIAQSYLQVLQQPRSAWSQEIELRPWVEKF